MLHLSGVLKSSSHWLNYTGFTGDATFFNVPSRNKDAVAPSPLMKESRRVYNCDDKRLSGSNKCWIIKSIKIFVDKKHWVDLYHYRVVVYTHCQHTFQFKQLVKVHVALYDPFKQQENNGSQ